MTTERKKTGVENFLSSYFSNFGKFTLLNLIFFVPLALSFAIFFFLCKFLAPQAIMLILPLGIILAAPFYSGVVVVSKGIYFGEITFGILGEFLKAVKENFKAYILHGVVAYIAFVGCYHGIVIYKHLASTSPVFYVMFFISLVLALFLLFMLFGVTLMSAFFDLKLKDVYKNSLLMTFGELKLNLFATLGIIVSLAVLSLPLMLFGILSNFWGETISVVLVSVYAVLLVALILPSVVSSIVTAAVYPDMKRVITGEAKANIEAIRKEEQEETESKKTPDFSDIDKDSLMKSGGEYVFYNGKMIKKSLILEELEEREEK